MIYVTQLSMITKNICGMVVAKGCSEGCLAGGCTDMGQQMEFGYSRWGVMRVSCRCRVVASRAKKWP